MPLVPPILLHQAWLTHSSLEQLSLTHTGPSLDQCTAGWPKGQAQLQQVAVLTNTGRLLLSLSDNPPKHPENKVNQRGCIQQSSTMKPADLLAVPGDAPWRIQYAPGSPRRSNPSWAYCSWQGLLPAHCVATGEDNNLLLCLPGPTACSCNCTLLLTKGRLSFLTTTLPLGCRPGSQILLLLVL